MRKLLLALAFTAVASMSASAAEVFLTPGELASFTQITFGGGPAPLDFTNLGLGNYSVQWGTNADGSTVFQTNGITLGAPRGVAGDTFTLVVTNNNGNPWNFSVSIDNGAQSSGPFLIPNNGGTHTFTFVLTGPLTQVSVTVGQTLPIAGNDRGAEYHIESIPEPASMLLLGTGLIGLAGAARRRFKGSL